MHYLLFYDFAENAVVARAPHREIHLELAREHVAKGTLILAGALADPVDGAVLVFEAESQETVLDFVRQDPYVANGVVKAWRVRPWTVALGTAL